MVFAAVSWVGVKQVMPSSVAIVEVEVEVEVLLQARESMLKSQARGFSMSRSATPSRVSQALRTALVVKLRRAWVRLVAEV